MTIYAVATGFVADFAMVCVAITATVTSGGSIMPQTAPAVGGTAIDNSVTNLLDFGIVGNIYIPFSG